MNIGEFRVSNRGQMALPAEARRRWNLGEGGSVEVADLGDSLGDDEKTAEERFFADKLRETEVALTKAQQQFPEDAEMVQVHRRVHKRKGSWWQLPKDLKEP